MPIKVKVSDYSISPTPPKFVASIDVVYEPVSGAASASGTVPGNFDLSLAWVAADFAFTGVTTPAAPVA